MNNSQVNEKRLTISEPYEDYSGMKYAVIYDSEEEHLTEKTKGIVKIKHGEDTAVFPINKLDWLINALQVIRKEKINE